MIPRLLELALAVLYLLIFKNYEDFGIPKIGIFNFSRTQRVAEAKSKINKSY